jgi:hypothetical protein
MALTARAEIESLLRARKLDVTLTSSVPWRDRRAAEDLAATGVPALDEALGGGLRRGQISEMVGPRSSGRTTAMCRALASATARGEVAAVIDASDRFDPSSAAGLGVDLSRLLWVRERGDAGRALRAMNLVLQAGGFGLVVFDLADVPLPALRAFPFTTWLRLARVMEGSQTVALIVATAHLARSPGGVTIAFEGRAPRACWTGASHRSRLLQGIATAPRVIGRCE